MYIGHFRDIRPDLQGRFLFWGLCVLMGIYVGGGVVVAVTADLLTDLFDAPTSYIH